MLRTWVAVGALLAAIVAFATAYRIEGFPPSVEPKSIEFGTATTQVLLDAGRSSLTDLDVDIEPLASRAEIYARLVESEPAQRSIAGAAGLQVGEIVVSGRVASQAFTRSSREPAAEQRAKQLAGEGQVKRLLFFAEEGLPVLSIFAQAPTPEQAIIVADAGARGLIAYARSLEATGRPSSAARVELRQLGAARGGWVNQGASKALAMLVFVGLSGLWCGAVLVGSNIAASLRRADPSPVCAHCGSDLGADAGFCPRCGSPVSAEETGGPAEPAEEAPLQHLEEAPVQQLIVSRWGSS